jgi:Mg2+ and Co2+ transporter CorA
VVCTTTRVTRRVRLHDSIGTCRKKVMGLLRLMGNKADVVKGLAKRCE